MAQAEDHEQRKGHRGRYLARRSKLDVLLSKRYANRQVNSLVRKETFGNVTVAQFLQRQ